MNERERYELLMRQPGTVFVFGSNVLGLHGGGAARAAFDNYGAEWGVGEGPQGRSYALPTVGQIGHTLPPEQITGHIAAFNQYAHDHPEQVFILTRIGCGIAGYKDAEIAPLFSASPPNVVLPAEWSAITKESQ